MSMKSLQFYNTKKNRNRNTVESTAIVRKGLARRHCIAVLQSPHPSLTSSRNRNRESHLWSKNRTIWHFTSPAINSSKLRWLNWTLEFGPQPDVPVLPLPQCYRPPELRETGCPKMALTQKGRGGMGRQAKQQLQEEACISNTTDQRVKEGKGENVNLAPQ